MNKKLQEMMSFLEKAIWVVLSLSLVALLVLVSAQVVARVFRISSIAPPDEVVSLFFIVITYMGAVVLAHENSHLQIDFIDTLFVKNQKGKNVLSLIQNLLNVAFLIILLYSSLSLFGNARMRTSPMLHLPQQLWYFPLVLSSALMLLSYLLKVIKSIKILVEKK